MKFLRMTRTFRLLVSKRKRNKARLGGLHLFKFILMALVLGSYSIGQAATPKDNAHQAIQAASDETCVHCYYVDGTNGSDSNPGTSKSQSWRTIQHAADSVGPGDTVLILPGTYRETVTPKQDGSANQPIRYVAADGPGTVSIRGSEPSSSLVWTQLTANTIGLPPGVDPANIYSADLSAWNLTGPPRFVVELDSSGQVAARLPLAREPDWEVTTEWKYAENWWTADGGSNPASCDPATDPDPNCDQASRSTTQLTDRTNDTDPPGVEAGNLTTLGDLTGATLVALDTVEGHYVYRRKIIAHDIAAGRIVVDRPCEFENGSGNPGLGWGSKYYVEGKPYLLDTPGEWWYDTKSKHIYLWPRTPGNPASEHIEISKRENGINLHNRSYITINSLTIEFLNGSAIYEVNGKNDKSYGNKLNNLTLLYANFGANIYQRVTADSPQQNIIDDFTVENSEIAYMDSYGIFIIGEWENGNDPNLFTHSGVQNTEIRNNEMHHLGFRSDSDNAYGLGFYFADHLRFEGNHVYDVAHNGVQFSESVIQSPNEYNFDPSEIKTGDIIVKDNIFEKACRLTTDCGGLKIWGSPPDNHVFRNFLVTGNIFRDTFGWSYVSDKRRHWIGGESSDVQGLGGFGLYLDHVSGIHVYRNIAYNNAYAGYMVYAYWSDGDLIFMNNVAANSLFGIRLDGGQFDTHSPVNTQLINNILVNNEGNGLSLSYNKDFTANMTVDHNLYFNNGWRPYEQGGLWGAGAMVLKEGNSKYIYPSLAEAQANTLWEAHGLEGDPAFWSYDSGDHNLFDGTWPDFHLTAASTNAIDRGTADLPASLTALLDAFGVVDYHLGSAYDIGRYEAGFLLVAEPTKLAVAPGGTVQYILELFPSNIPYNVTLSTTSPSPDLKLSLVPPTLTAAQVATLTVTDTQSGPLTPGEWYTLPITGVGSDFTSTASLDLLVGGARIFLPVLQR